MKSKSIRLSVLSFIAMASISHAAVTFSGQANSTGFTVDTSTVLSIVHADVGYAFGDGANGYWDVLTDGQFGPVDQNGGSLSTPISGSTANHLMFSLNGGPASIGSISVYSGWQDNGRIEQHYEVYTTTDTTVNGSATWTLLTTVGGGGSNGATQFASGSDNSLKVTIFDNSSSVLASNVTGLRFNFLGQQNGYVGYREIDVQVIPETSTTLLGGLGALALLRRRRK
jgi:hypothetical protein